MFYIDTHIYFYTRSQWFFDSKSEFTTNISDDDAVQFCRILNEDNVNYSVCGAKFLVYFTLVGG